MATIIIMLLQQDRDRHQLKWGSKGLQVIAEKRGSGLALLGMDMTHRTAKPDKVSINPCNNSLLPEGLPSDGTPPESPLEKITTKLLLSWIPPCNWPNGGDSGIAVPCVNIQNHLINNSSGKWIIILMHIIFAIGYKSIHRLCIHAPTSLYQITEMLRKSTCYNKVKLVKHCLSSQSSISLNHEFNAGNFIYA